MALQQSIEQANHGAISFFIEHTDVILTEALEYAAQENLFAVARFLINTHNASVPQALTIAIEAQPPHHQAIDQLLDLIPPVDLNAALRIMQEHPIEPEADHALYRMRLYQMGARNVDDIGPMNIGAMIGNDHDGGSVNADVAMMGSDIDVSI